MLRFLRINNPSIILLNVLLSCALHIIIAIRPFDFSHLLNYSEPFSKTVFSFLCNQGNYSFYILVALGCVFQIIQSVLVNRIINDFKIISKRNYIGGFLFILCSSFDKTWLLFSPVQIALLFLLLIVYNVFKLSNQEKFYKQFFDIGFFSTISMLFYFPSSFFLLLVFPILYSVRPFNFKEMMRILVGISTPIYIILAIFFLNDQLSFLPSSLINLAHQQFLSKSFFSGQAIGLFILLAFWLAFAALSLLILPFSISIQTRKMIGVLAIFSVLCILFFFIPTHYSMIYWLTLSPVISIAFTVVFTEMKRDLIPNIIFALLLLSAFIPNILL